jgi:hypothetical protein
MLTLPVIARKRVGGVVRKVALKRARNCGAVVMGELRKQQVSCAARKSKELAPINT